MVVPRGRGRSAATGQALPAVEYAPNERDADDRNVLSATCTVRSRPRYAAVVATYQNVASAKLVHVRAGTGTPVYEIRDPYPDRAQAEATAVARLARQTHELRMTVPGNPRLVSEVVVSLANWPEADASRWTILRAEHTLSPQRGYVTSITAEPLEG